MQRSQRFPWFVATATVLGLLVAASGCSVSPGTVGGEGGKGSGGVSSTGGQSQTGGTSASGGSVSTGGTVNTGGSVSTGGTVNTGGSVSTGGTTESGGRIGSGGASGGGAGAAGSGTGGRTGTGGRPGTGGTSGGGGQPGLGGSSAPGGTAGTSRPGGGTGAGGVGRGGTTGGGGANAGGSTGAGGSTSTTPGGKSAGCGKTSTVTDYNKGNPISISAGGQTRRYILQIPTNYVNTTAYTLILSVHALDSNDKTMYDWKYYQLLPLSNNTVIFAAPNGQKNGQPCSGTSVGDSGCGWPSGNMPLMDAVVKQVTDNFCVDTDHIYATGWSYGASMSYEIACERPLEQAATNGWGVRAVAIYSGAQMSGSCKPSTSNPVAFYESHGTNDNVLGYDGGVTLAKNYATANGCAAFSPTKASGSHVCTSATGCKTGYPTEFCSFVGSHTPFPDSGSSSNTWGPAEVWKFFSQF